MGKLSVGDKIKLPVTIQLNTWNAFLVDATGSEIQEFDGGRDETISLIGEVLNKWDTEQQTKLALMEELLAVLRYHELHNDDWAQLCLSCGALAKECGPDDGEQHPQEVYQKYLGMGCSVAQLHGASVRDLTDPCTFNEIVEYKRFVLHAPDCRATARRKELEARIVELKKEIEKPE